MPALHLSEFSSRVHASANRNLVALPALDAWLDEICQQKLGLAQNYSERQAKAAGWVRTVARKAMTRAGSTQELSATEAQALAQSEPWAAKALAEGRALSRLRLGDEEKESIQEALDWLRAESGPALSGDWSRISFKQAEQGHREWIEAGQKEALRQAEATAAFEGCERVMALQSQPGLEGWSWVSVISPEALNREGALMRHCVGSYAEEVEDGSCSIWSLRDPEGKPHITVETRDIKFAQAAPAGPAELAKLKARLERQRLGLEFDEDDEPGTPVERRLQQIRGFANAVISAKDIGAVEELLMRFHQNGAPVTQSGPDLARAGRAITPAHFGEMKIWRRGDPLDEAEAIARIDALRWDALPAQERLDAVWTAASLFERMRYEGAFKRLGPFLTEESMGPKFERAQEIAEGFGLTLGASRLSGRALDPRSEQDRQDCEALANAPLPLHPRSAVKEGVILARLGFDEILAQFVSEAKTRLGEDFARELDQQLASLSPPARIGFGAFSNKMIWRPGPEAYAEAETLAQALAATEPADSKEIERRSGLVEFCAALSFHSAAEILFQSLPSSKAIDSAALKKAGYSIGRAAQGSPPGFQERLWTPSELSREAANAIAQRGREPASSREHFQMIELFSRLGHSDAASSLINSLLEQGQETHEKLATRLSVSQVELSDLLIERFAQTRSDLEELLTLSMEGGLASSARAALGRLLRLPESEFESKDEAEAMSKSYEGQLKALNLIDQCVAETQERPRVRAALQGRMDADSFTEALDSCVPLSSLRDLLSGARDSTVYKVICALAPALSHAALDNPAPGKDYQRELHGDARKNLAKFFIDGPLGFDHGQRDSLIMAITGAGASMLVKGKLGTRESRPRNSGVRHLPG